MRDYERQLQAAKENFNAEFQQFQHRSRVCQELLEQARAQLEAADEIERQIAEEHKRYQEWQDSKIAEANLNAETHLERFERRAREILKQYIQQEVKEKAAVHHMSKLLKEQER